jgi:hypothetical protein
MTNDEIRAILKAKNLRVVEHKKHTTHWKYWKDGSPGTTDHDYYIVIWLDADKTKYGHISADYTHRYGIRVLATYNGRTFWFQSGAVADEIPNDHLEHMKDIDAHIFSKLPVFDPELIEVSW